MKNIKTLIVYVIVLFSSIMVLQTANSASTDDKIANEILVYINQYRTQHGLTKLAMNSTISQEAAKHSRDMAHHTIPFGHDGFSHRIHYLHQHISPSSSGAENVAYNYTTARIVVDGWIKSPAHRQNILGHYNLTGIGVARDKSGKIFYTQLFLRADKSGAACKRGRVMMRGTHHLGQCAYS